MKYRVTISKKEKIVGEIRSNLMCPCTALQVLYEDYKGNRVPKEFIKQALDDINRIVELLKYMNETKID